jgi:hypothetical protein
VNDVVLCVGPCIYKAKHTGRRGAAPTQFRLPSCVQDELEYPTRIQFSNVPKTEKAVNGLSFTAFAKEKRPITVSFIMGEEFWA